MPGRSRRLRTPGVRRPALFWAAVLLALAVGIALGGGVLSRFTTQGDIRDLRTTVAQLERDNTALTNRVRVADAFADTTAPQTLGKSLVGYPIVFVVAPGASMSDVEAIAARVTSAGGSIAGTVNLTAKLYGNDESERLRTSVDNLAPQGVTLDAGLIDPRARAGDLMGAILLAKDTAPNPAVVNPTQGGADALDALRQAGYLSYDGQNPPGGRAAVIVTGGHGRDDQAAAGQGIGQFAAGLSLHGTGTVLVGRTGSAQGTGPVVVIRQDKQFSARLATVDDVDTTVGQVQAVVALAQATRGTVKAYGTGVR